MEMLMQPMSRRKAVGLKAAALAASTIGWGALATAAGAADGPFNILPYVHPELRRFIPAILAVPPVTPSAEQLPRFRQDALLRGRPVLPEPTWTERKIPGAPGAPAVTIYIVGAKPDAPRRPVIVHMHGGGYIMGEARSDLRLAQEVAQAVDCVVVTVDYRLSPETRFPGALEDNYAALKWVHDHADELGVDRTRIAVMGESAGGGHAAMLAIATRDRGEVPIVFQALIYPMLDDRTGSTRPVPPHIGTIGWNSVMNRFGWGALLGVPAGAPHVPAGAVPARVTDLRGLAPAFIGVGSIDLFVDEDVEYARRLIESGVATELEVVPGAFHGFDLMPGTKIGPQFRERLHAALRKALWPERES